MVTGSGAKVPFSDGHAAITGGLQILGQNALVERKTEADLRFPLDRAGVELVPEALLVASRQKRRARRAADGAGDVPVGAADTVFCDGIDVRRRHVRRAVAPDVAIAHV